MLTFNPVWFCMYYHTIVDLGFIGFDETIYNTFLWNMSHNVYIGFRYSTALTKNEVSTI